MPALLIVPISVVALALLPMYWAPLASVTPLSVAVLPTAVRMAPLVAVLSVPPVTTVPLLRLMRPPLIADRVPPALFSAL